MPMTPHKVEVTMAPKTQRVIALTAAIETGGFHDFAENETITETVIKRAAEYLKFLEGDK